MKKLAGIGNVLVAGFFIAMTSISVLLPSFTVAETIQDHLVHILFILLISGIIGLIISNDLILCTGFGCAAALAFFLKSASNTELKNPEINDGDKIVIAHINLSITFPEQIKNALENRNIDVISFQEYTPDWVEIIPTILDTAFKFSSQNVRMDLYGKMIVSKHPIYENENIYFDDVPNLDVEIDKNNKRYKIVSAYMMPALDNASRQKAKTQFSVIEKELIEKPKNVIVLGEFNQVYWSGDILTFRHRTKLLNSRRNVNPSEFKMPYDHIFYSADMECFHFDELNGAEGNHIGCVASFQVKKNKITRLR
ncbi:MAG: hypothetical protein RIR48_3170 [Bacteroidota bacterium]